MESECQTSKRQPALSLLVEEISKLSWRYPSFLLISAVFAYAMTLPPQIFVFFSENVVNLNINQITAPDFILSFIKFGAVVATVMFVCSLAWIVSEEWICLLVEASLRRRVMGQMHRFPLETFDVAQRGDWLTRMNGDLRNTEQFISSSLPKQLRDLVVLVVISVMFVQYRAWIGLGLLLSAVVLAVVNIVIQRRLTPIFASLRQMHGDIFQSLLESFEGIRTIRSLGIQRHMAAQFDARVRGIVVQSLSVAKKVGLLNGGNSLLTNIVTTFCLSAIAWQLGQGQFRLADVLSYPFYISMFYAATLGLVGSILDWGHFFVEGGRFAAAFSNAEPISKDTDVQPRANISYHDVQTIEIKGLEVGFYQREPLTLPFDLELRRGQTLVITGFSGSGKSTLLESLAGVRAMRAKVVVMKNSDRSPNSRRVISQSERYYLATGLSSFIEQRPFIFEGSVRDNLNCVRSGAAATDDELYDALNAVNLKQFVRDAGGLSFVIRDAGRNLSEGQKYRLGLARAFVQARDLLLLDEPFAALDDKSVDVIAKHLKTTASTRFCVLVTHTVPASLHYDQLLDLSLFAVPHQPLTFGTPAPETVLDSGV